MRGLVKEKELKNNLRLQNTLLNGSLSGYIMEPSKKKEILHWLTEYKLLDFLNESLVLKKP